MMIQSNGMNNTQEFSMHMKPKMVDKVKQDGLYNKYNFKVHKSIPQAEYSGAASPDLSGSATPNNPFGQNTSP